MRRETLYRLGGWVTLEKRHCVWGRHSLDGKADGWVIVDAGPRRAGDVRRRRWQVSWAARWVKPKRTYEALEFGQWIAPGTTNGRSTCRAYTLSWNPCNAEGPVTVRYHFERQPAGLTREYSINPWVNYGTTAATAICRTTSPAVEMRGTVCHHTPRLAGRRQSDCALGRGDHRFRESAANHTTD